jgi:hypothetical protein
MRAADQQRAARRRYLQLRVAGGSVVHRPHPGKPGKRQVGIFGLASLPGDQAHALRRRAVAVKGELLDLVLVPGGPDAKAILEKGSAG